MPEPVEVPASVNIKRQPDRVSVYRNADGQAAFAIMRWDGTGKKLTLPVTHDGEKFQSAGYPYKRPLYNSDIIAAHEGWPVLIVEGEKSAEDGAEHLPPGWCITTWAGGTGAIGKTDWSILNGRRCVIWPDSDEPGLTAARKIVDMLGPSVAVVTPYQECPKGWDLADPLPNGITQDMVAASIQKAFGLTAGPTAAAPSPAVLSVLPDAPPPGDDDEDGFIDEHVFWRALGLDDEYYYVMPGRTGVILRMTARELMSASGCLRIINDLPHWELGFPARTGGGADWLKAGSSIIRECENAGIYEESRICGRGVWIDEGRVVVNTGDQLIVDGGAVRPSKVRSKNIYKASAALFAEPYDQSNEATLADGRTIVELCNAPRWDKPVHGDLLAGWIATALVCGAMHWRTHIWVTGNAGSGKSTVINSIAAACIGDVAVYPLGETTEAGIRQHIGTDARPVIFDEMEGTDTQRTQNDNRRQAIIQLMRVSSSESRGRIMKGSASHKGAAFTMRSSFLVASIGMSLKEAPDLTRTLVLSLRALPSDASPEQRREADERFATLNRLAVRLPHDISTRLFSRQTRLVTVIRKNAQMFCEVITEMLGTGRLGDQVGVLLAGRCSLTSEKVMTRAECMEYASRFDWREVVITPGDREDRQLLNHLKQVVVRVIDDFGNNVMRTVGELVDNGLGMLPIQDRNISADKVNHILLRFGIKACKIVEGVYLSSRNEELNKLFKGSTNPIDWFSVVARNPEVEKCKQLVRFSGASTQAILIPKGEWYA